MKILAFDTSNSFCSVALSNGNKILSYKEDFSKSKQAEILLPIIEEVLEDAQIKYEDLNAIAVSIGPGSFTGIRIGLAAAKGICLAKKLPLIGITTLESIAFQANQENKSSSLYAIIDARRNQLYIQKFDQNNKPLTNPSLVDRGDTSFIDNKEPFIIAGNGAKLVKEKIEKLNNYQGIFLAENVSEAKSISQLALAKHQNNEKTPDQALYIRKPDAKPNA